MSDPDTDFSGIDSPDDEVADIGANQVFDDSGMPESQLKDATDDESDFDELQPGDLRGDNS